MCSVTIGCYRAALGHPMKWRPLNSPPGTGAAHGFCMLLISALALIRSLLRNSLMRNVSERSALTNGLTVRIGYGVLVQARLLSRSVTEIFDDRLQPWGISSTQFVLLSVIGQKEPITRSQIARLQHLDKSTLTRNLKTIFSEGWIEEVGENADGRSRPIALTAAGKELLLNGQPAWVGPKPRLKNCSAKTMRWRLSPSQTA